MHSSTRLRAALACGMVLVGSAVAFGQDWPQWRGPNRDGKLVGFAPPETWPRQLARGWKTTVGVGDSTPALVGDRLYVFARQDNEEVLVCLSAADGAKIWEYRYSVQPFQGPDAREHLGPRSSPAVAEGKVVVLGVLGVLSCVSADDGKLLWKNDKYTAVPRFHTAMSALIVDGLVIAHLGGETDGAVVAFDAASGQEKWKWSGEGPHYASPALMTVDGQKSIVTLTARSAVGLALADGKLLWQVPFAPQGMAYNVATPIVDGSTVIITGAGRGTRALKIEKQGDAFAAKEIWNSPQPAPQFSSPVLKDGLLFGLSNQNRLYCIDTRDGKTVWTDTVARGQRGFGSVVDAGSAILVLPNDSELLVLKPDAKQYSEIARYKVADTPTYAHPVISGKRIFVKDRDSVILWMLG